MSSRADRSEARAERKVARAERMATRREAAHRRKEWGTAMCEKLWGLQKELINTYKYDRGGEVVLGKIEAALDELEEKDLPTGDFDDDPWDRLLRLIQAVAHTLSFYDGSKRECLRCINLELRYLELAVKWAQQNSQVAEILDFIGDAYSRRYQLLNRLEDIDKAIDCHCRAMSLLPKGDEKILEHLKMLSLKYSNRYIHSARADNASADKAIECLDQLVSLTPKGHEDLSSHLESLDLIQRVRFEPIGKLEDLDRAIERHSKVLLLMPEADTRLPSLLNILGQWYQSRFEHFGKLEDIDKAIEYASRAVSLTPEADESMTSCLHHLGASHQTRFDRLGTVEDLSKVIECHSRIVSLLSESDRLMSPMLRALSISYQDRYKLLSEIEDVDRAIECLSQVISLAPLDVSLWLKELGRSYLMRFMRLDQAEDIDKAIEYYSRSISLMDEGGSDMLERLDILATLYHSRYLRLDKVEDIEEAIKLYSRALSLTPKGHAKRYSRLDCLGSSHKSRFRGLQKIEDINLAVEYQTQAISAVPESNERLPMLLSSLGSSYLIRSMDLDQAADIEKAIEYYSRVISLAREGDTCMALWQNSLGLAYNRRFKKFGVVQDIDWAIEYQSQAISITPEGHPHLVVWLDSLGDSYFRRFEQLGEVEDINKSIEYRSRMVSLMPEDDDNMHLKLADLGISHRTRFQRLGKLEDLGQAIEYHSQAVLMKPKKNPEMAIRYLDIGNTYVDRFGYFGKLEDIDKAIGYHLQAISLASEGDRCMPVLLFNLGTSHQSRFSLLDTMEDLEKAIKYKLRAQVLAHLAPQSDQPKFLSSLGSSYRARFDKLGNLEDIDKAIEYQTRANLLTPEGHAFKPGVLGSLGSSHQRRFEKLGPKNVKDIEIAIEHQSRMMSIAPEGHAMMPSWLGSLGTSYRIRFEHIRNVDDINKAIDFESRAVSLTPEDDSDLCSRLYTLGASYRIRYRHLNDPDSLDRSIECFKRSASLPMGHPHARFQSAFEWALLAPERSSSEALDAFQTAIDITPHLIRLGDHVTQRYERVRLINELATRAAATAIAQEQYDRALEWLEQGRSVVWNQTLQLQTPFNELSKANPKLADKLRRVADELHHASSRSKDEFSQSNDGHLPEQATQKHHRLAEQYEELLSEARSIQGFEGFLRPKKASDLLRAARRGPVVLVNVDKSRSDALLILPGATEVQCVPLPKLRHSDIAAAREKLDESLHHQGLRERDGTRRPDREWTERRKKPESEVDPFEGVLRTLWFAVTKPILKSLGYLKRPPTIDSMPHVTWCTTGPLTFLPLHASGLYDQGKSRIFNFVISSYTPTLSALLTVPTRPPTTHTKVLAIGQAATKGHAPLPGTKSELASIQKYVHPPNQYDQIVDSKATTAAGLDAMETSHWVHLACHATQDVQDPTQSGFALHDGMLSLSAIMQKSFGNKGLAFLSACQTATGDKNRPDESVHLASGMLFAGYPSVIATMWSVKDQDAPVIANRVYEQLLKGGRMDHRDSASALHVATKELREQVEEKEFGRWVPYIHIGV
ncbi:Aromatic di-alanine and TPR containing protein [Ceratobasidium theobromae]|uniref:Aromatic di-alanine and TPR containing protein n=1 Tax=Ceratobasidium theobromae TaxID=1582974 RepID=A0A5N5QBD8_9AGAM|nr:Aromatic di-alanine and TPR containing protein [Ceratobasidium theobromae]